MSIILRSIHSLHEIGSKKNQEDYLWPVAGAADTHQTIFIVCDGVGGSDNGEFASRFIAEFTGEMLSDIPFEELTEASINDILGAAQTKMIENVQQQSLNTDMATTFCLLVLKDSRAFIAWCGDSRAYHFRNGKIIYRTNDHSLVSSLVRNGEITEDEAATHPQKNIILKAIRADHSPIEAEAHHIDDVQQGDSFLLCTDGLLENIRDRELPALVYHEPVAEIEQLFQQRCYGQTRDNYSMYLIRTAPATIAKKKKNRLLPWLLLLPVLTAGLLVYNYTLPREKDNSSIPVLIPTYDSSEETEPDMPAIPDTPAEPLEKKQKETNHTTRDVPQDSTARSRQHHKN